MTEPVNGPDRAEHSARRARARSLLNDAKRKNDEALAEDVAKEVLRLYGIQTPRGHSVIDGAELAAKTAELTPPFVLKAVASRAIHKSDLGLVKLHLQSEVDVRRAMEELEAGGHTAGIVIDRFLLEQMVPPGHEIIVGGIRDPQLGLVLMVGLGGVFVETFEDVSFRTCPVTRADAADMLDELRAAPILDGHRGGSIASRDRIIDVLLRVGGADGLLADLPEYVTEVDLNPVIVNATDATSVDARVLLAHSSAKSPRADRARARSDFSALFMPKSIAIVGISTGGTAQGNKFLKQLQEFGYPGRIYPVHPTAEVIDGVRCYPSLSALPETVDYCYIAVPAASVPGLVLEGTNKVKFAQVISSGFGETAAGRDLETELVEAAEASGVRVLGPNCLGTYSPRGGMTFSGNAPREPGTVGVISQSGGLGVDVMRLGGRMGIRFSGLVSAGNCSDVDVSELLDFYLSDPATDVVGLYVESLRRGEEVVAQLRALSTQKPVVLLKGGSTRLGQRAAASHTGALAGDQRIWSGMARQTGTALVQTVKDFLGALLAFQSFGVESLPYSDNVFLFGNGGGANVLATDALARAGLNVPPLSADAVESMERLGLPPGASLLNPLDFPVGALSVDEGNIARTVLDHVTSAEPGGSLIAHCNMEALQGSANKAAILGNLVDAVVESTDKNRKSWRHMLVLTCDGSPEMEQERQTFRERALSSGVPVYNEMSDAVAALAAVTDRDRFLQRSVEWSESS